MVLLTVDPASPVPLYRQLVERVRALVDGGSLAVGHRLPPSRVLAGQLAVNRSTVLRAYQELWALGYLEARPGSYSTIRRRVRIVGESERRAAPLIDWERAAAPAARDLAETHRRFARLSGRPDGPDVISFASLAGDRCLAPVAELRRAVDRVLREESNAVLDYGSPQGYEPLREAIAVRMRAHGMAVQPAEIMVTNGAQHGIELVARLFAGPSGSAVIEAPTYSAAVPLLRFAGLELVEVEMRADGMDLDALAEVLRSRRPAFVYTMPTFQNPTGITTGQTHRERLLALCEAHRVPLVEDGFEEELKYFGRAVLPVKSMDHRGVVIYLSTFSKVLFPGLRVGWIAAERGCIERLVALNRFASLSTTTLGQAAFARLLREGRFEAHVRRVHAAYRRRMSALLGALEERMPSGVTWTRPEGGYTLWVRLAAQRGGEEVLLAKLAEHRVAVAPGSLFFAGTASELGFRLSISNLTETAIEEGVARLGRALAAVVS